MALLSLETRTAYNVDESASPSIESEAADAFSRAIPDGLMVLKASGPEFTSSQQLVPQPVSAPEQSIVTSSDGSNAEAVALPAGEDEPSMVQSGDNCGGKIGGGISAQPAAARHTPPAKANPSEIDGLPVAALGRAVVPGRQASDQKYQSDAAFVMAICTGLRCLQSLAARERALRLAPSSVASMARLPAQLLQSRYKLHHFQVS